MPTGYTACIKDGVSFEEFVWGCARAFGALILMRDDPQDAPIPKEFTIDPYYKLEAEKAERQLQELETMDDKTAELRAVQQYDEYCTDNFIADKADKELRLKYQTMIAQVEAWQPPTSEHQGLKDFMLQQLNDSMKWDCHEPREKPKRRTGAEWKEMEVEHAKWRVERYRHEYEKEIERTEGRNKWLAALRASVQIPEKLVPEKS